MPKSISFTRMASDVYEDWRFEDPELIEMIMECYRRDFSENPVPISWGYENSLECEYHVYDEGGYSFYDAEDGMGMYHRSYASMPICDTYVRMSVIQIIIDEADYERLLYDNKSVVEYMKEQVQEILDVY